jgi:cell wall-associated NlpC family hydrolase
VQAALSQQGVPYRYGTSNPNVSFDCSGLTSYAWAQAGVSIQRTSRSQFASLPRVSRSDIQPGDLIFFYSPVSHVSLYVGNGIQVHAPNTGSVVHTRAVNWSNVVGVGRPG